MNVMQTKQLKNQSNQALWTDINESVSAQISGGGNNRGDTSFPGLGIPEEKRKLVVALVLLFANPFA